MRSLSSLAVLSAVFSATFGVACSSTAPGLPEADVATDEAAERWNDMNDPARVDATFVYDVASLPVRGSVTTPPIASYYWPTATDSVNLRWDGPGTLSPSEKFEKAFGKTGLEMAVSRDTGIRGQAWRRECTQESDCASLRDNSICAKPRKPGSDELEDRGRCIPMWWGLCHGWAAYAFSEPAAKNPVTRNGVTFYAADLEALMTLLYSKGLPTKFLSERCNRDGTVTGSSGVSEDGHGRVREGECRDMNPGAFHVLATNMVGLRKQSFVYDRTWDAEVWNQPVRDFVVTNTEGGKLKEVTGREAMALISPGDNDYAFNADAKRFFYVEMRLRYIAEPRPARTPVNPDLYTRTDRFQYILETDEAGNILGGEWVGESKREHPDFAWWPTGRPRGIVAGGLITYPEVKALNDEAAAGGDGPAPTTETLLQGVTLARGTNAYATFGVPPGATLTVNLRGTGETELYVRLGQRPTNLRFDCRGTGTATEKTCTLTAPAAGGSYFIRARAREASTVTVSATVTR